MLDLTLGEVAGGPPEVVARALAAGALGDRLRYGPPAGLPEVRAAVAAHVGTDPARVALTTGASGGFLACLLELGRPGANLVLPDPVYPAYPALARRCGLAVRHYPLPDDGSTESVDPDRVAELVDDDTAAVVLVSPGNPTGRTVPVDDLLQVAALTRRAGCPLVLDQAYADLVAGGPVGTDVLWSVAPHAVVLRSFSKSFSLSGLRIGALLAPEHLVGPLASAHFAAVMAAPTAGQLAVAACLDPAVARSHLDRSRARLAVRAAAARDVLGAVPGCRPLPGSLGVFTWLEVPGPADPVVAALRDEHGIAVQSGAAFGPSGRCRLRVLTDITADDLDRVADALRIEVGHVVPA